MYYGLKINDFIINVWGAIKKFLKKIHFKNTISDLSGIDAYVLDCGIALSAR